MEEINIQKENLNIEEIATPKPEIKKPDAAELEKVRQGFKYFNRWMILMWRFGLGKHINALSRWTGKIMVITHIGRKSGKRHQTPVNYAIIKGDIYCTAGFGQIADWYRNIIAKPNVEVWLPNGWWAGIANEYIKEENRIPILREILLSSGKAAEAFGVDPLQMTNDELAKATEDYRIVRIQRTNALTGNGGPGEYNWIWPLTTMLLLPLTLILMLRKKR